MNTPVEDAMALPLRDAAAYQNPTKQPFRVVDSRMVVTAGATIFDKIKIFRGDLFDSEAESWRELEPGAGMTPFQRQDWLASWQSHCAAANSEEAVTAFCYRNGELALILPLSFWRRWGIACLSWRGHGANDYCGPVIGETVRDLLDQAAVSSLLKHVAKEIGGVDIVYLPKQLAQIGGRPNPFMLKRSEPYHAGIHAIFLGNSWDDYYKAQRSAKSRRRLKEKHNALHRSGEVEFRLAETGAEKARMVAACLELKSRQLAKLGHWDPFLDQNLRQLLNSYAMTCQGNRFWAAAITVNATPVAVAFGFADKDQWLLYQMAIASGQTAQYSPGTLLLHKLMQHCIGQNVPRLDLSLGDEGYKLEWCNEHGVLTTSFQPTSFTGILALQVLKARAWAHRTIANHPGAYDFAKKLKARMAQRRTGAAASSPGGSQSS